MSDVADLAKVKANSRKFIGGLDRTSLGRFTVPISLLAAMDLLHRALMTLEDNSAVEDARARVRNLSSSTGISTRDAAAEMLFWWSVSDEEPLWGRKHLTEDYKDSISRLFDIRDYPAMHDYFESGIWDTVFIARCIADGIDPEMSVNLFRTADA